MEPGDRPLGFVTSPHSTPPEDNPHSPTSQLWRLVKTWVDLFLVALVIVMVLALTVPISTQVLRGFGVASNVAIIALFLVYGMRLPTSEVLSGLRNVKLQGGIFLSTYVMFPVIGLLAFAATQPVIGRDLAQGVLFLSLLPSTVQSSVAFTSIARGNVPGAICGATVSNTLGIFITPLLVWLFMDVSGATSSGGGFQTIVLMLLVPFVVGQLLERWSGRWLRSHAWVTQLTDRSTILLVVFAAVAQATADGTWAALTLWSLAALLAISAVMLTLALVGTWFGGGVLKLPRTDRIALLMCGSKKSLATGLPMSIVLFPAATAAAVALPLIIFHQLQLVVCAILARRFAYSRE